ncbi:polysaccharide deacetylase family protein [Alteriqipengyuania sp. 357]
MTSVYLTIDTEYSSALPHGPCPVDRAENFARSIACITPDGPAGITHKLDLLVRYDQRAVFFVDPMPALVWGVAAIEDVVAPILAAGQDVQLHCHTEWLDKAQPDGPFAGMSGRNIKDFPFEEQCRILAWARDTLVSAGAPAPVAFRAGNYGANRNTLRALREIGLHYDSSHTPGIAGGDSDLGLQSTDNQPLLYEGIIEVPVSCVGDLGGTLRHAQVTALSLREMRAALHHARDGRMTCFTLVSHSFELINRRSLAINKVVRNRFEGLCRTLQKTHGIWTADYVNSPPLRVFQRSDMPQPAPASTLAVGMRYAEQAVSNTLYGAL